MPENELRWPGRRRDMAVRGFGRDSVRLGPSSSVRFLRADGLYTPWVSASSLWTNHQGVFLRRRGPDGTPGATLEGLAWGNIRQAELKNFEGGQSVLATVGSVAIVTLFVAAVAADVKDASDCAKGSSGCHGGSHTATAAQVASVGAHAASAVDAANDRGTPGAPSDRYFSLPDAERPSAEGARPLFTDAARRKAVIKGLVALETTVTPDAKGEPRPQPGAFAGARFGNFVDAGVGVRTLSRGDQAPAQRVVAGRVGLHGEFGARRHFALPVSVDVGAGEGVTTYVRVNWGARVRIFDELTIGLHPASPTFVERETGGGRSGWTVSSGAELSWGF
ncbi:MAG TPA: hypothetical protein VFS43_43320 [Polyangiaceae bacterium]|nr:hypothetical protein [Polyangiaceae bacterium]